MLYIEIGFIEIKYDILNVSVDIIKISIKGKRVYGVYFENGIDVIVIVL